MCRVPRVILAGTCALGAAIVGGCASKQLPAQPVAGPIVQQPPTFPTYQQLATIHNTRVMQLDKFRASRVIVGMWYTDANGQAQQDHVEGSLRFRRPNDVYLYLQKAGAVDVAVLGSNSEKYWWLNLLENKQAMIGEHARFAPERVDRFAMPVHPLDLLDLLALTPVPSFAASNHTVRYDALRDAIVLTVPSKFGFRDLLVSQHNHQPVGAAIYDEMGREIARSVLEEPVPVDIAMTRVEDQPLVASAASMIFAGSDARAKLTIYSPTTRGWETRQDRAFDVDYLLEKYSIADVIFLDEAPVDSLSRSVGVGN